MEIPRRKIKSITGNGTTNLKWNATAGRRIFGFLLTLSYAGGTNTLAALMTSITRLAVLVGSVEKWELTGTKLRDWMLLHGTTYDFNGVPNTGCQVSIPLAPEWFNDFMQDVLAWNPNRLGGPISVEIDSTASLTVTVIELSDPFVNRPSAGIITLEEMTSKAAGTEFFTDNEFSVRGKLLGVSIYPDSGGSNEVTPAGLEVGEDNVSMHEDLTSAQNDELLERYSLTPAASGRTANVYDMQFVQREDLSRAIDLDKWKTARLRIQAGSAMSGTIKTLLQRIEHVPS